MAWVKTRVYKIWEGMKQRCNNPNNPRYKYYGGKGVRLCKEWEESSSAFVQWALKNGYSDDLTIDRIDTNSGYCPENCRFISISEQQRNRTDNRILETAKGNIILMEAERKYGISKSTIRQRLAKGWSVDEALNTPANTLYQRRKKGNAT